MREMARVRIDTGGLGNEERLEEGMETREQKR